MLNHIGSEQLECEVADEANKIEYAHDLSGNFTFLNKAGEFISGYSAQEACQMNISQLVTPELVAQIHEQSPEMVEQDLGLVFEIDLIGKDGRTVALEVSTRLVVRDGRPIEIHGIAMPSVLRRASTSRVRQRCVHKDFVLRQPERW